MLILGLLGMYFDAAVVFVTSQTLFLRLALAILCKESKAFSPRMLSSDSFLTIAQFSLQFVVPVLDQEIKIGLC